MTDTQQIARMRFHCRRGMLEIDAMLQPYFEQHCAQFTPAECDRFERLLECTDQALYDWLIGKETPDDPALAQLIADIRGH